MTKKPKPTSDDPPLTIPLPLTRGKANKSHTVRVRVTEAEHDQMVQHAETLGCTVTQMLLGLYLTHGHRIETVDCWGARPIVTARLRTG